MTYSDVFHVRVTQYVVCISSACRIWAINILQFKESTLQLETKYAGRNNTVLPFYSWITCCDKLKNDYKYKSRNKSIRINMELNKSSNMGEDTSTYMSVIAVANTTESNSQLAVGPENIYPALVECFGIISLGYLAGR